MLCCSQRRQWLCLIDQLNPLEANKVQIWTKHAVISLEGIVYTKGLAKLGNIVSETLLRMQMFPSLAARETCIAETNFAARKQKMFLPWSQKHFCFPDTNFASETYVSQFSHPGKHNKKHCCRNNVS